MNRIVQAVFHMPRKARLAAVFGAVILAAGLAAVGIVHQTRKNAQPDPAPYINDAIAAAQQADALPKIKKAANTLREMRSHSMQPGTKARLLVALGNLHRLWVEMSTDERESKFHLDVAERYYTEALPLSEKNTSRPSIQRGLAMIEYRRGNWIDAAQQFSVLLQKDLSPEKWINLELKRCRCLIESGRMTEAWDALTSILRRYTGGTIRQRTQLLFGDLLLGELKQRHSAAPRKIESAFANPLPHRDEELRSRAYSVFEELLERLRDDDLRRMRVLNNLLELCILEDDLDQAYTYVNMLETVTGHQNEQIRSYMLLADLERKQGKSSEAERVLRFCLKEFPEHGQTRRVRLSLYELYRDNGQARKALQELKTLVKNIADREWAERLSAEMLPDREASMTARYDDSPQRALVLAELRERVNDIQARAEPRWLLIQDRILYLKAVLAFRAGDWDASEDHVARYLAEAPFGNYNKQLLVQDAKTAQQIERSPAVQAARALRFLASHLDDKRSEQMFELLLKRYYDMGLYAATIRTAEAAFVHALTKAKDNPVESLRLPILQTLALLAQCNSRQGSNESANRLFRRVMLRLDELNPSVDFYEDWSRAASQSGQMREALRRLEVAQNYLTDSAAQTRLRIQALALRWQLGFPGTLDAIKLELDRLRNLSPPPDPQRFETLYTPLLEHSLADDPKAMPPLFRDWLADAPNFQGMQYWMVRYLRAMILSNQGAQAKQDLEALLERSPNNEREPPPYVASTLAHFDRLQAIDRQVQELKNRGLTRE